VDDSLKIKFNVNVAQMIKVLEKTQLLCSTMKCNNHKVMI